MNLDRLRKLAIRGDRIKQSFESEVVDEAFDEVREKIVSSWTKANIHDKEAHHEAKLALYVLDKVRADMRAAISRGKEAQKHIDEARKSNG